MTDSVLRILMIEDDDQDYLLTQYLLGEAKGGRFRLTRVATLEEGLAALQTEFDAVLLDLTLPDCRGWLSFEEVHSRAPDVPVIILTGLHDEELGMRAVKEGAQDFVVKGQFDGPLLARTIRYAIERKRTATQLRDYAKELQARNLAMAEDLQMAREVQEAFLPREYPEFVAGSGAERRRVGFCHVYHPSAAVGGDFFNVIPLAEHRAGLFICDVMGHGMRAALITAVVRGLLEELRPVADDPARLLTQLNASFLHVLRRRDPLIFVSALYGVLDLATSDFAYVSAGHPSPLLVRDNGARYEWLLARVRGEGALGIFERQRHEAAHVRVETGDTLVLLTDGILEALSPDGEPFGRKGIEISMRKRLEAGQAMCDVLEGVVSDAKAHVGSGPLDDDICMLGVRTTRAGGDREG